MDLKSKEFVGREGVTKAFQFALEPLEGTAQALERKGIKKIDLAMQEAAQKIRLLYDICVKDILVHSLESLYFDWNALAEAYIEFKAGDGKNYRSLSKDLTTAISKAVSGNLPSGFKKVDDFASQSFVDDVLTEIAKTSTELTEEQRAEYKEIFKTTTGLVPLMAKFITSRCTALDSWMPDRVAENFETFMSNIPLVSRFLESDDSAAFVEAHPEVAEFTNPKFYKFCLTPEGINGYNSIINGTVTEEGITDNGYNVTVNLLNQKHRADKTYEGAFYRKLATLDQQILMPKPKQFKIDKLENDEDLCTLLTDLHDSVSDKYLFDIVTHVKRADKSGVVVTGAQLHDLSHLVGKDHGYLYNQILEQEQARAEFALSDIENEIAENSNRNKEVAKLLKKSPDSILEAEKEELKEKKAELTAKKKEIEKRLATLTLYVNSRIYNFAEIELLSDTSGVFALYVSALGDAYDKVQSAYAAVVNKHVFQGAKLFGQEETVIVIKRYFDALIEFNKQLRLIRECSESDRADVVFYNRLDEITLELPKIIKAVNLTRNYLTQKPDDLAHPYQIGLGTSANFAGKWWSEGAIAKGINLIFKDADTDTPFFYYATMAPDMKSYELKPAADGVPCYEFLSYKKDPSGSAMYIPRILFRSKAIKMAFANDKDLEYFDITENMSQPVRVYRTVYDAYDKGLHKNDALTSGKVSPEEFKKYNKDIIELTIQMCRYYGSWSRYNFDSIKAEDYSTFSELCNAIDVCTTDMSWVRIDKEFVDARIAAGDLFAFKFIGKDLYKYEKDESHLSNYVRIFRSILSDENIKAPNLKLNSRPMLSYRPAIIDAPVTHAEGSILVNRNDSEGNHIPKDIHTELYKYYNGMISKEQMSEEAVEYIDLAVTHVNPYAITKSRRHGKERYYFSCSYSKNARCMMDRFNPINDTITDKLENGSYRILSVIRGITDLLYYVLYDTDHKTVLEEGSLNVVTPDGINYAERLDQLSKDRQRSKSAAWDYDKSIDNVKSIYTENAIRRILKIAVDNAAVLCIEKISDNFKDKMSKIDNQLYKSFETRLANALVDYYDKQGKKFEMGSMQLPLQLASASISSNSSQNGIMFKINTAYTTTMCPKTGFVNLFDLSTVTSIAAKRKFLKQFDKIGINKAGNRLQFDFDYSRFIVRKQTAKTKWTIYAGGPATTFNKEHKFYEFTDNSAEHELSWLIRSGYGAANLVEAIDILPNEQIVAIYDLFEDTIRCTTVKHCKEVEKDYFRSPALENNSVTLSPSQVAARNLAAKFSWHQSEGKKYKGDEYTSAWLDYAQSKGLED